MSMGEDVKFDMAMKHQLSLTATNDAYYHNRWLTKDGRLLEISEMDTDHIVSTVKFLIRNMRYQHCTGYLDLFKEELIKRGL